MRNPRHRILRSVLVSAWLLSLAAVCTAQTGKVGKAPQVGLTIDAQGVMQPFTGDLDQMVERGFVRVLVVPNKTYYFNDNGTQRGITYDTFELVQKELAKEIKRDQKPKVKHPKVQFIYVSVGREDILPALRAGKGDVVAANLTITPLREEVVAFAAPHTTDVREVVLTGPASPSVSTLDDLAGKEVFVRKATSYYEHLVALNKRFAAENRAAIKLREAPDELEAEDLIEMLNAGLVPMLVVDKHIADFWKKVFPNVTVHDALAVHTGGEIAWAIRKDSPQLKAFLDRAVATLTSGHLVDERQEILARYLKRLNYVKNATGDAERKRFLALVDLFRKYGDRYDVDWMLMAAQGYQESRLDQGAHSPVGAIGVMQLMPTTGKEMNVGDITQVDANIHAGVKYVRTMADRYYENEPMTKLDKVLFTFAAYNAGAGRVAQLRNEAAKRGLDRNVWFRNVEYIAAERNGQETVTYVSNIYKYYVAYQLIEDSLRERRDAKDSLKKVAN
jgi:membrane-bound lytic murein transglycosylase MltF